MTTFEFTFDESFSIQANRRTRQCSMVNKYAVALKTFLVAIFIGVAVVSGMGRVYAGVAMSLVMIALVVLGSRVDEGPLKRRVRRHWHYKQRITIELLEDEVRSSTESVKTQVLWKVFTRARRFDDGFLLFQGPSHQNWLPISSIVSGSEEDAHQLINSHVTDYSKV